jgi:glycosyltransferase involved in cell wall biosynthesis
MTAGPPAEDRAAGAPAAADAVAADAGAADAGAKDAGAKDAGAKDAGAKDAGAKDAGAAADRPAGRLRVAYVLGTAAGGTARHAGLLAEGCRRAGLAVMAIGPAGSRAAFTAGIASLPGAAPLAPATPAPGLGLGPGHPAPGPASAAAAPAPIAYHRVEIGVRPRPGRDLAALAALARVLHRAGPDAVHAHGLRAGAFAAAALWPGRPARRPALIVTVHNAPPAARGSRAVYAGLELICARRADMLLCASADLAARLRRRGAARVAEFDVPASPAPPPAAADVARARADLGPPGRPAVLSVGRLTEQKGLDILLAAARRWQERVPAPVLAIAGEGPLGAGLAAAARQAGVDLALLGQRDDVPALLAAADVIAVPSRWEARALVVQEAMAAGRPIVATRVGGIPALTGEDAAILIPPGDERQLADAVLAVLDDPARAARLAAAARERAATLPGPADAVAAVLAVYRACAPSRPPRRRG